MEAKALDMLFMQQLLLYIVIFAIKKVFKLEAKGSRGATGVLKPLVHMEGDNNRGK